MNLKRVKTQIPSPPPHPPQDLCSFAFQVNESLLVSFSFSILGDDRGLNEGYGVRRELLADIEIVGNRAVTTTEELADSVQCSTQTKG